MKDCCGNCAFFDTERGDLCVRFPPPQQALVRVMDWCGEYLREEDDINGVVRTVAAPAPATPPPEPEKANGARAVLSLTKGQRLSSLADLAKVKTQ